MTKNIKTKYRKESAGSLMNANVPVALSSKTIADVEKDIYKKKKTLESINYIYVVDENEILLGAVSIKEIFRQAKNRKISNFVEKKLISVQVDTDEELVANTALKNNIKSVPVVSAEGKFLGVVLSDTILEIAHRQTQEDISKLAGVELPDNVKDINSLSAIAALKHRLPWLVIGLAGGFVMSKIVGFFELTLAENLILASFMPLIIYMSAAVQTQIGYFIVRDLAFNPKLNFLVYALKQIKVVFLISFIVSLLLFIGSFFMYGQLSIVFAISIAMFLSILSSIGTGVFIPYIFHRLKMDPASASGPIATIMQDMLSVVVYFGVANMIL